MERKLNIPPPITEENKDEYLEELSKITEADDWIERHSIENKSNHEVNKTEQHRDVKTSFKEELPLFVQFMISPILLAPFIKTVIHGSGQDFSLVELSLSVGIVVGSFVLPWCCHRFGRLSVLVVASCWLSVIFIFISLTHHVSSLVVLYAMLGLGLPLWTVIASYSQEYTEKSMQGRVQSFANTASSGCLLVVYLLLALGHSHLLIARAFWFCTALGVLAVLLIWLLSTFERPMVSPSS